MQFLMNCDQVFDILTRGPFPTGDGGDYAVEQHLGCCHECRRLAAALRPAVALFHEALAPEQQNRLPAYQSAAARPAQAAHQPALAARVERLMQQRDWRPAALARSVRAPGRDWRNTVRYAAALALALVAGLAALGLGEYQRRAADAEQRFIARGSRPSTFANNPTEMGLLQLGGMRLPVSCLPAVPANVAYSCCTRCHAAHNAHGPVVKSVALILQSCSICHES